MRIISRCFGLSVILLVSIILYAQMMMLNIYKDELVNCISTAMTSTQIVMQEQIEDINYGTNTRRRNIESNQQYLEEFTANFYKLTTSNASFKIKVFGIDYTKGFLDLEIESSFKMFNGQTKVIRSRKTSIVDILL